MSGTDFLRRLVGGLESAAVPYMLAGSTASSFHGEPRTTHDIDLVVELHGRALPGLRAAFPEDDYYYDDDAALTAVRTERQFNLIDMASGWKADLIIRKRRAFSEEEFRRRSSVEIEGFKVWIASAEDVVVSKLEWSMKSGSERQLRDVAGVLRLQSQLDTKYIDTWVRVLGLEAQWGAARGIAGLSST